MAQEEDRVDDKKSKLNGNYQLDSGVDETFFVGASKGKRKLPQWLDHFNARDLKILFKCSIAVWLNTILIFINPTLRVIGQAGFFGSIVLFIAPPSGVVFVHTLAGATVILGLALGWAWGVIVMKAALATRPQADLQAKYAQLQQTAVNTTNIGQATGQTTYLQIQIFEGALLDTRVTITYFCMLGVFIYLVARIRVAMPKLTLVSIFALVVADTFMVTAPLIPTFEGTIPKAMVLPVSIAVGIGIVCNVVFFPQSTSHIVLDGIKDVISPMKGFATALLFNFKHPESHMDLERLQRIKTGIADAYKDLEASAKFLPMDFTAGRWSPDDISSLSDPLRNLVVAFAELMQLQVTYEENQLKEEELLNVADEMFDEKNQQAHAHVGHHQISRAVDFRAKNRHPETDDLRHQTLRTVADSSTTLIEAMEQGLQVVEQAVSGDVRKSKEPERTTDAHRNILAVLKKAEADFTSLTNPMILVHHSKFFDESGRVIVPEGTDLRPPLAGLMLGTLFQERILNLSIALGAILDKVVVLEAERRERRFWLPRGLQNIFSWGLGKESIPGPTEGSLELKMTATHLSHEESKNRKHRSRKVKGESESGATDTAESRLQAMRRPTGRYRHKSSQALLKITRWFSSTEGVFALRVLVVTIALSVPAVIPSTAGFFYREKGFWATIMAQLCIVPYTSDFVSGLLIKTTMTVVGGVVGLAAWYIGAGNGPGNPYGMSAITAVVIVIFMWWRLFGPADQTAAGMMLTSTAFMVIAYSWIDTHIPSYGNPGVGYNIVWRRILLALVGFAAASLVMFFPKPPSGSKHYRRILSESLSDVRDRYALFASTWHSPPTDLVSIASKEGIKTEAILTSLLTPITLTKYEFSTSNIDTSTLSAACNICIALNQCISQLLMYTAKLPEDLRDAFVRHSGAADESLVADVMCVITLLQGALQTGNPLPALLPTPLLNRSFKAGRQAGSGLDGAAGSTAGKLLAEEAGRKYVSAVHAFVHLLGLLDELVIVVKRAVGETSDVDLERF